jgi:hypothetical protein
MGKGLLRILRIGHVIFQSQLTFHFDSWGMQLESKAKLQHFLAVRRTFNFTAWAGGIPNPLILFHFWTSQIYNYF